MKELLNQILDDRKAARQFYRLQSIIQNMDVELIGESEHPDSVQIDYKDWEEITDLVYDE